MISPYEIQRSKLKIDIVSVIERSGVQLQKAGKDFKANCPFHTEKTPSFTVSPTKQVYHCFGCGVGGDVLDFVMKRNGLSFPQALEFLGITNGATTLSPKRISRQTRGHKQHQRRIKRDAQNKKEFEAWVLSYGFYILDWIDVVDSSLPFLSWDQIKEIADLIKQRTVWAHHAWIIHTSGDLEAIKNLYLEQTV